MLSQSLLNDFDADVAIGLDLPGKAYTSNQLLRAEQQFVFSLKLFSTAGPWLIAPGFGFQVLADRVAFIAQRIFDAKSIAGLEAIRHDGSLC